MANKNSSKVAVDQNRESYADDAAARRVALVGPDGDLSGRTSPATFTDFELIKTNELLKLILVELRINNFHNVLITDEEIKDCDVEE